jgi:hypothetical protein
MRRKILADLQNILEGEYPVGWVSSNFTSNEAAADRSNFQQLQTIYRSCMDNTPEKGLRDLENILRRMGDVYPVENETERSAATGNAIVLLAQAGLDSVVSLRPYVHDDVCYRLSSARLR